MDLKPPETRLRPTTFQRVSIKFTEEMSFTSEQIEQLRSGIEQNQGRNLRKFGSGSIKSPGVDVKAFKGEEADDGDSNDLATTTLHADWRLSHISKDGIDFDIIFADPLAVSQNDTPDILVVQLDLGEYYGSESGIEMKESQVLYT